jgi:hypothetical protein
MTPMTERILILDFGPKHVQMVGRKTAACRRS